MIINQNNKSKGWFSYRVIPFIFVHLISWVECYICKYILCNILPKWKMKYSKERLRAVSPLRNWSNSENHPRRSTSKTTKILRENKHTRTISMFSIQVLGVVCLLSNSPQSKCIFSKNLLVLLWWCNYSVYYLFLAISKALQNDDQNGNRFKINHHKHNY